VVEPAVDGVGREQAVPAEQARVIGGEPVTVPAARADLPRLVAAVEPDLVAAGVLVVAALAVQLRTVRFSIQTSLALSTTMPWPTRWRPSTITVLRFIPRRWRCGVRITTFSG
jgi:hypothetical protein